MTKTKSYSLALEVDRSLRLALNNGQFEALAFYLDKFQDSEQAAHDLMGSGQQEVLVLVELIRKQNPSGGG